VSWLSACQSQSGLLFCDPKEDSGVWKNVEFCTLAAILSETVQVMHQISIEY